jgi:hypothetical protein
MKKLLSIICILLISCNSPEKQIQKEIDNYVKNNFKDPKSYEQITFNITDTITEKSHIQRMIDLDSFFIEEDIERLKIYKDFNINVIDIYKDYQESLKNNQDSLRLHNRQLTNLKTNKILWIHAKLKYRAKNGFGGLDIGEARLTFNDSLRLIKFDEIEKEK